MCEIKRKQQIFRIYIPSLKDSTLKLLKKRSYTVNMYFKICIIYFSLKISNHQLIENGKMVQKQKLFHFIQNIIELKISTYNIAHKFVYSIYFPQNTYIWITSQYFMFSWPLKNIAFIMVHHQRKHGTYGTCLNQPQLSYKYFKQPLKWRVKIILYFG